MSEQNETDKTYNFLPFKTLPATPQTRVVGNEKVGTLEVPVYGYALVGESKAVTELAERHFRGSNENASELEVARLLVDYSAESALILIRHRLNPKATMAQVEKLPSALMGELATLLREEFEAMKAPDAGEGEEGKAS